MGFWNFGKSKEEKQKEENKFKLLGEIKALIEISEDLIKRLNEGLAKAIDDSVISRINEVISKINKTRDHLYESYTYLDALNIPYTINELVDANKEINFGDLDDHIKILIKMNILKKKDLSKISFIRTNVTRLIKDLPNFNF